MLRRLTIWTSVLCLSLPCIFLFSSGSSVLAKSYTEKEAKYLYKIQKEDAKEEYGRKKNNRTPSGYMTVEEYEMLSAPKDKTQAEIPSSLLPIFSLTKSFVPSVEKSTGVNVINAA